MKNIHVLPTENPSRLRYNIKSKIWELNKFYKYHTDIKSTHNIYITSEEHIKDCWVLNMRFNEVYYCKEWYGIQPITKKIILTSDPNLIEKGVQAIDNEFLEWFVKNPNCEKVEIDELTDYKFYGIIIPNKKKELKTNLEKLPFPELVNEFSEFYKNIQLVEEPKQEIDETDSIRSWYQKMFNKVVETLTNGNSVTFINKKEIKGNNTLLFHFYNKDQVIGELRKILNPEHFGFFKYSVVDMRDFKEYIKQDWCVNILKNWDDFGIPDIIIERYIHDKRAFGDVISYEDNLKQETIEEASERNIKNLKDIDSKRFTKAGFKLGAKWKGDINAKEILEHLNHLMRLPSSHIDKFTDENGNITMKWFEQYK